MIADMISQNAREASVIVWRIFQLLVGEGIPNAERQKLILVHWVKELENPPTLNEEARLIGFNLLARYFNQRPEDSETFSELVASYAPKFKDLQTPSKAYTVFRLIQELAWWPSLVDFVVCTIRDATTLKDRKMIGAAQYLAAVSDRLESWIVFGVFAKFFLGRLDPPPLALQAVVTMVKKHTRPESKRILLNIIAAIWNRARTEDETQTKGPILRHFLFDVIPVVCQSPEDWLDSETSGIVDLLAGLQKASEPPKTDQFNHSYDTVDPEEFPALRPEQIDWLNLGRAMPVTMTDDELEKLQKLKKPSR
jgi:hypothetical protein